MRSVAVHYLKIINLISKNISKQVCLIGIIQTTVIGKKHQDYLRETYILILVNTLNIVLIQSGYS